MAEEAKPLTRAVLSIPAETAMYRPQMAARLKDPTRPHAPVAPPPKKNPTPRPEEYRVPYRATPPARPEEKPRAVIRKPAAPEEVVHPPQPPDLRRLPDPVPPVRPESKPPTAVRKPSAAEPVVDFGFDSITIDPAPAPQIPRPPEPTRIPERVLSAPAPSMGDDESWYCSLTAVAAPPKRVERPVLPRHEPIRPAPKPPACPEQTELVDASVLVDTVRQGRKGKALPAPARPLSAPLVLGVFAAVTGVMLPLAAAFESNRIFGTLGFCVSGLLLPLAPLAWITGLAAERRRREQGLRTERRVIVGRLLGQWGTVLLAAEGTLGLILVAALRVTGKLPASFWSK